MPKVYGLHEVELKSGVRAEDFERFVREEVYPLPKVSGIEAYLLRCDRGAQEGKYLVVYAMGSVETRNQHFPPEGGSSEEAEQWSETNASMWEKWDTMATRFGPGTNAHIGDYVMVED